MIIKFDKLIKNYNIKPLGVIHIGAHGAEEQDAYVESGVNDIIWIEANSKLAQTLEQKFSKNKDVEIINALLSDKDGEQVDFHITNNGQSSSLLELGIHKNLFPGVKVSETIRMTSETLDKVLKNKQLEDKKYNFLNIDVQGAELLVLKGARKTLSRVDAIYTEINTDYVYKNCALVGELDEFLSNFGFSRVATEMWQNHPWGDALYTKSVSK